MNALITRFVSNRHTSGAALVYAIAAFGCPIASIWFPEYKVKLDHTRRILEALAVFYGFAAAGDASPAKPPLTPDAPKAP